MNNRGLVERFPLEIGERTIYCIVRKHPRAKRVSVRILSRSEVVLVVPEKGSLGNAKEFLVSKREWIAKKTFQLPERESWKSFFRKTPSLWLDRKERKLCWEFSPDRKKITYHVESDFIQASFPEGNDEDDMLFSLVVKLATIYLPQRLELCAEKVDVSYDRTRVGNQSSRWGSCSSRRVISLNWRILLLDHNLGEYVLYHELAHLKHMNHSIHYWQLLEEWVPGARKFDQELNRQGRRLMLLGES
jgi:predicted metal-dependent hydrolase